MFETVIAGYRWFFLQIADLIGLGWGIVALSFLTSLAMTPLMKAVAGIVRRESEYQSVILPQIAAIKERYGSDMERHGHIQRLYSRYSYSPLSAIKKVLPLFVQIPFLLLTYFMLKDTSQLVGEGFLFLRDLGAPDGLIPGYLLPFLFVSGRGMAIESDCALNLFPVLMTFVNVVTVYATPGFLQKDCKQAIGIALLFLIMLYSAPSALLLYWTINNTITLMRTVFGGKCAGMLMLYNRIRAIPDFVSVVRMSLNNRTLAAVSLISLLISLYCFVTVIMFRSMNDACHGLTYTLSLGGMFHALALSAFAAMFLLAKERGLLKWCGGVLFSLPILFAVFITSLFLFARHLFWMFDLRFDFNGISSVLFFCVLFVCLVCPLIVLSSVELFKKRRSTSSLFKIDAIFLVMPAIIAVHYAYSSEGFHLPIVSAVVLVVYMTAPLLLLLFLLAPLFIKWLFGQTIFDIIAGAIVGVYVVPMLSTASGVFAFDNNFFVRIGVLLVSVLLVTKAKKGLVKVFLCSLAILVLFHAVYTRLSESEFGKSSAVRCGDGGFQGITAIKTNSIYLLVFDGYAHRTVRTALDLDESRPIEDILASNGYVVYDAYTVGAGTVESMSAMFTLGGISGGSQRSTMAGDNVFSDFLKQSGYRTSYLMCGYSMPNYGERMPGDFYYPQAESKKSPQDILMSCILRGYLSQSPQTFNHYTHDDWLSEKEKELYGHIGKKRFVYAHSNMPDHLCVDPRGRKSDAEERRIYLPRLRKAHNEIVHDIEKLAKLDKDAIVIVASDHGGFLISPDSPGKVDARHLLDRHGILLAIRWPENYKPVLNINCLQNVLLEVMIYLSGDVSLKRYAVDGATHAIRYPIGSLNGLVKDGVIQSGTKRGESLFEAAKSLFKR